MKRVHYALGAVAVLAPAVTGIPAHAAEDNTTDSSIKVVSLEHSAARSANVPAVPGPCTASLLSQANVDSLITLFGWWLGDLKAGHVCIGTVSVERHFKNNNCVNINFEVIYGAHSSQGQVISLPHRCGNAGSTKRFNSAFRESFSEIQPGHEVLACVSSTYTGQYCKAVHGT
jgi:hypothetical protein